MLFDTWHFRLPAFYITLWSLAEVIAACVWPLRQSCKKVSLLHCIVAFTLSSIWLLYHFSVDGLQSVSLTDFEVPGTFEHHILSTSMAYFIVDMPFAIAFHKTFVLHHLICIMAFGSIQGYLVYWGVDFMTWDVAPRIAPSHLHQYMQGIWGQDPRETDRQMQLLMGGFNGVFNLWVAELGGLFFHINRMLQNTDLELPSRGLFLVMFMFSRCYVWPMYLRELYKAAATKNSRYHLVGALLETGLFLTNMHFLYKNIAPIMKTGRLMPSKPRGFHRKWLDRHSSWKRVCSFVISKDKLELSRSLDGSSSNRDQSSPTPTSQCAQEPSRQKSVNSKVPQGEEKKEK